jgi:hypothetical protein|tara:strand:- start:866 stop:1543 length:678 start_codon:yes stop_codon:yes gene_type:complete
MFRKKLIIKYTDILEKKDAEDMFKKIPDNFPKYFLSIPKTIFNPELKKFIPYARTIKTCPGFINLYKRSLLITSPFDIYIELGDDKIISSTAGQTNFKIADIHSEEQFLKYIPNNKKYKFIIKINLPFFIDTNISLSMNPSYYHFNDLNVLPGILPFNYKGDIHFFIPIEKEKNQIYIKKGDPLFLLTPLCEKKINLKFKKYNNTYKPSLTFSTLKKYILKNIII